MLAFPSNPEQLSYIFQLPYDVGQDTIKKTVIVTQHARLETHFPCHELMNQPWSFIFSWGRWITNENVTVFICLDRV